MKRDVNFYTTALERHKPFCCLQDATSSSNSTTHLSVGRPADCQAGSSPPGAPPQASASTQATAPSLSTSFTSSLGLQSLDCVESTHPSSSTPAPTTTTLASSTCSSYELFSSITAPYSGSFSTVLAPHSLFSDNPPPLITSQPTNVTPVRARSLTTAAAPQSKQGAHHDHFSTLHSDALDAFLMKQASSNVPPSHSHLVAENTSLVAQCCPVNVPQLQPAHFRGNLINSNLPRFFLPSTLQEPAHQSLSVSPQGNPEPSPAAAFASKPSYGRHVTASRLSLLTVPSPLSVPPTTSSSFDGCHAQPQTSLSLLGDTSRDLSFSELLEVNDWILQ